MLTPKEIDAKLYGIGLKVQRVIADLNALRAELFNQGQQDGIEGVTAAEKPAVKKP